QSAAAKLSRLLKNYKMPDGQKIKPHSIRIDGEIVKGFYRNDFEEAWDRYLQPLPTRETGLTAVTTVTSVTHDGQSMFSVSGLSPKPVKKPEYEGCRETGTSTDSTAVTDVTDVTPLSIYEGRTSPEMVANGAAEPAVTFMAPEDADCPFS